MNRLIRLVGVLPLLIILVISIWDVVANHKLSIPTLWWMVLGINAAMASLKLEQVRDGIKGILYSGIIVNVLLVVTYLLGQAHDSITIVVFLSYSVFAYLVSILDLINTRFVRMSKSERPFYSSEKVSNESDNQS